jgi:hypothetical protein
MSEKYDYPLEAPLNIARGGQLVRPPSGRPPIETVPMAAATWTWTEREIPTPAALDAATQFLPELAGVLNEGRLVAVVARIINVPCLRCALWYRAWEDDVRPCPGCGEVPK